ncbi:Long chain acyl-CoA synthetase 1 [Glycine soja]|uniref:Long chain acyl-CoA synthetase 1 n=1 Tax=Glycine soja TaxID=3848 RepID=A0A0B2R460_GLYSO|nr:Long chain acyl-CoA synthetase 1 [Glycine soja]
MQGPGAANFIIDHAEVDFVFIEDKKVKELLNPECKSSKRLKDKLKLIRVTTMVCFISLTKEETAKATAIRIKPYSWHDFLHLGKEYPKSTFPPQAHDICAIMYTSGTSGDPKGVVLTNENVMALVRGMDLFTEQFEDKMIVDDVYLSFLPLAHILDCTIKWDIGEMLPNGVIKIIDMNKNLVKLSQGEYIALEHLENVYGVTPIVEDIWVYGNSFKSMLVAVVVPNEEVANKWAYSNGHIASFSKLYFLGQLKKYVLFELKLIVERNKVTSTDNEMMLLSM